MSTNFKKNNSQNTHANLYTKIKEKQFNQDYHFNLWGEIKYLNT